MVNSVSNVNIANQAINAAKQAEVKNLVSYLNGELLKQAPDTFTSTTKSAAKTSGLFCGLPLLNFLKNKRIAGKSAEFSQQVADLSKKLVDGDKATVDAFKGIFKKGGKFTDKVANYVKTVDANSKAYSTTTQAIKGLKDTAKINAKIAKLQAKLDKGTGAKFINKMRQAKLDKLTTPVEQAAEDASKSGIKNLIGKIGGKIKPVFEKVGGSKVGKAFKAVGNSKVGKVFKKSGAGFMLVFSGISETLTEVIPTFKELGKEKGMKQAGKSALKVVGDTVGYVAGHAVGKYAGAIIGAKVGTALGSVVPGIGNVVGAAVGFVGGLLGSFIAGKITKAITGPSEREKAKAEQTKNAVEEIAKDDEAIEQLKQAAIEKIQMEYETTGAISEESYKALESLNKLEEQKQAQQPKNVNPFVAQA